MSTQTNSVKGFEIFEFEDVEMTRTNDAPTSTLDPTKGALKVYYFPESDHFMLMMNDVHYSIPYHSTITCNGEMKPRTYTLPLDDNFYLLKFHNIPHSEALQNFETILGHCSKFFYETDRNPIGEKTNSADVSTAFSEASAKSVEMPGGAEDKQKVKKSIFAKAANTITKVFSGSNKNPNMTKVKTIDELKDVSGDYLTMYEFPRDEIEKWFKSSRSYENVSDQSGSTQIVETMFSKFVVDYPKELIESEERLTKEVQINREMQDKSRNKQQKYREKEVMCMTRERELQDQLNGIRGEKMKIEVIQRERLFADELTKRDNLMHMHENQFARESQEFKDRERALINEVQSKITELKQKEQLTQEEQAEFARREQELIDLNKRMEGERSEMEKRHEALRKQAQAREAQIKDKERFFEVQKNEFKDKEENLRGKVEQRLAELREKQKMTEEESAEFKRKQHELDQMNKAIEKERVNLEKKMNEIQTKGQRELEQLIKKEEKTESERMKFIQKEKELEAKVRERLSELKGKQKLTENETKELEKKEKELDKMMKKTLADQANLQKKEETLVDKIHHREAELQERERMTENERAEMNDIKQRLIKKTELTETERKDLMSMRDRMIQEVEQRETELMRREKLTETELKELQRKEQEMEKKLQRELAALREKQDLTEAERVEMMQREDELLKMTKMREMEIVHGKKKLEEISMREKELMAQNEMMIKGHKDVQQNVAELHEQLDMPIIAQEKITVSKVSTGRNEETRVGREHQRTEETSKGMIGSQETTTSG